MVGSDAVIRVSSVIRPSLIGTLKSTRTNARAPERLRSRMEYFGIRQKHEEHEGHEGHENLVFVSFMSFVLSFSKAISSKDPRSDSSSPTRCRTTPSP